MKHFKLTSETKVNLFGVTLFRIEATVAGHWGEAGTKGGWVEKESNISQESDSGNAWVYGDAQVYGNARVYGNAWEKSPLQIQGSRHFVNVFKRFFLRIGCNEFSFEYWKDNFEKIGKNNNYTEEQIREYGLYIDLAINIYGLKEKTEE